MRTDQEKDGAWLEAIALFQAVRDRDQGAAKHLLETSASRDRTVEGLLSMLGVYLRGQSADELDRFIAAAHRAGPPPRFGGCRPLPPLPAHSPPGQHPHPEQQRHHPQQQHHQPGQQRHRPQQQRHHPQQQRHHPEDR